MLPQADPPLKIIPLLDVFDASVARFADRPATDFFGKKLAIASLAGWSKRAARGFQAIGVRHGTRVGLCLANCLIPSFCYFAILKAGGTVVNFNPLYVEREIAHQIEDFVRPSWSPSMPIRSIRRSRRCSARPVSSGSSSALCGAPFRW